MARQKTSARMIKLVHVAKRQLGLDDDTYRGMLLSITGKKSTANMTSRELLAVCDALKKKGFKVTRPRVMDNSDQARKIRSLWLELADNGIVRNRSETALLAYVCRITKTERMEWCSAKQLQAVIETLKAWGNRIADESAQARIKDILEEQ
jgi:phage gp16-like protein